jgi:uncharacterized Zn finger protein (UPF0148 family)
VSFHLKCPSCGAPLQLPSGTVADKAICPRCQSEFAGACIARPNESIAETTRRTTTDPAITERLPADTRITTTPEPDGSAMHSLAQLKIEVENAAKYRQVALLIYSLFAGLCLVGIVAISIGQRGQRHPLGGAICMSVLFLVLEILVAFALADPVVSVLCRWGASYGLALLLLASGVVAAWAILFLTCQGLLQAL